MFTFLRSIGLEPIEWSQAVQLTKKASPYIGEILDAALAEAQAIVVVMTPDDEARLLPPFWTKGEPEYEKEFRAQPRPNVLFEAGLALGRARDRTVLIEVGTIKPFSDIGGMHTVRLDDRTQRRQDLANRLQAAGCAVNLSGTDWHTSGNFQINDAPTSTSAVGETETKAVQSSDIVKEKLSEVEENILKLLAGGEDVRKATVQLASSLKVGFDKCNTMSIICERRAI